MKRKPSRLIILAACALLLCVLIFIGRFVWLTEYAETPVLISESGEFRVVVSMVGEPDWPFGATHCRATLYCGTTRLNSCSFSVYNDGANVSSGNFTVSWNGTGAVITAVGDEQGAEDHALPFGNN